MIMHNPHELELTSLMSKTLIHEPHTIHLFDVIFWAIFNAQNSIHHLTVPHITLYMY